MNLHPMHDYVIVRPDAEQERTTAAGIVIPATSKKEGLQVGTVLAVGAGRHESGQLIAPQAVRGERVYYTRFAGTEIEYEGQKLHLLRDGDLIAVEVAGATA